MFGLKSYIVCSIIVMLVCGAAGYFVSNYFRMQVALKITTQQLDLLKHHREVTEQATVKAEEELNKNMELQRNALSEIQNSGHLSGVSNPTWMLQYQTPSS